MTFVIVVNFNSKKDTLECLESLAKTKGLRVIVVDNASKDGSVAAIKKQFPKVKLIENNQNLGFAAGINQGVKQALKNKAEYIIPLNSDTLVKSDFIEFLVKRVNSDSRIGIVGPKIYFAPGFEFHKDRYKKSQQGKVIWYAGGEIDWANVMGKHLGVDQVDKGQFDQAKETNFVSGCCMLIKREVFEKVGFFDEKYFLYLEDMDFCHRAKKAGFKLFFEPSSVIWHKNAASSGGSGSDLQAYYFTRNRLLFTARYASLRTYLAVLREAVRFLLKGEEWQKQGVKDFFLKRFGKGSFS